MTRTPFVRRLPPTLVVPLACLVLALFVTRIHVGWLGHEYLESGRQIQLHDAILQGTATSPNQYRVLSAWGAEGLLRLLRGLGVPDANFLGFVSARVLLGWAVLLLAVGYWRRLGASLGTALSGVVMFSWGATYACRDTNLSFHTYLDLAFYLYAASQVLDGRFGRVPWIVLFAALNRETSGLIALLPLAAWEGGKSGESGDRARRRQVTESVAISLVVYGLVQLGLRLAYDPQGTQTAYGMRPFTLELLRYNLLREQTWTYLFATYSLLPLAALAWWGHWPRQVRTWFWVVVPAWFAVHFTAAIVSETRLMLVPLVLVFLPGFLSGVTGRVAAPGTAPTSSEGEFVLRPAPRRLARTGSPQRVAGPSKM